MNPRSCHPPSSSRSKVQLLFLWSRSPLFRLLSRNVIREACLYLGGYLFLPAVDSHDLTVFDLKNGSHQRVRLSEAIQDYCGFCLTEDSEVMAMGGTAAISVNLLDFSLHKEANMREFRLWPGVVKHSLFAYVFGGCSKSAERFHILRKRWSALPSMSTPRSRFTPAIHNSEIYLPSGDFLDSELEVFTPRTELYRLLPLRVGAATENSVSFVVGNELVIVSSSGVGVWGVESGRIKAERIYVGQERPREYLMLIAPVRVGQVMYCVGMEGLWRFDLKKKRFV